MSSRTAILTIEGIEPAGDGAAYVRVGGRRVPVDFAIPGERVEVRLPQGQDTAAELLNVVEASPHRVQPRCPYFGTCGGCMWQHIAYAEQLQLKRRFLESLFRRALGDRAPDVRPMLAAGEPWGFRSKVHFVFAPERRSGGLVMGHYRRHSMSVVPVAECPVHASDGNRVAFAIRDALRAARVVGADPRGPGGRDAGIARHIVVRTTSAPPETLATLVVTRNDKSLRPAMRRVVESEQPPDGLYLNVHDRPGPFLFGRETRRLHGRERARETVAGISFLVSPTAFFQTNVAAARQMVDVVLENVPVPATALDLYAGAGLFSLPLARRGARVVAVEENGQAVEDGEASRAFNRIAESQCRFVRARVEALVREPRPRAVPSRPDLVLIDPPRPGCPREVLDWICRTLRPRHIVYVSCNPEALAADLSVPFAASYRAVLVQPIDMFPHTPHIESIVVLADRSAA